MQAAKEAISKFTSHKGHRTDVDETVQPAVTQEQVKPHRHEDPIAHEEVLPEKHTHNLIPTEHREVRHEDPDQLKSNLNTHLGQFQSSSQTQQTTQSASAAPTVTGEHVHHHVHENVVPVVHKSTIQPEVVHTTQPIHETHHARSQHHGVSALPMKTLDEFTKSGGQIDGTAGTTHEQYDGAPRPYNSKLETTMKKLGFSGSSHHNDRSHGRNVAGAGAASAGVGVAGAGVGVLGSDHTHRQSDSDVRGAGRRDRSSSASSSDMEYAADGTKVKKNKLGNMLGR